MIPLTLENGATTAVLKSRCCPAPGELRFPRQPGFNAKGFDEQLVLHPCSADLFIFARAKSINSSFSLPLEKVRSCSLVDYMTESTYACVLLATSLS